MSVRSCCDANIIFSFAVNDSNNEYVKKYLREVGSGTYIHLWEVERTFQHTFRTILEELGDVLIASVNQTAVDMSARSPKLGKPSKKLIEVTFEQYYEESIKTHPRLNAISWLDKYKKLFLKKYSITNLIDDSDKRLNLKEHIAQQAVAQTSEYVRKFKKKFKKVESTPRIKASAISTWEEVIDDAKSRNDKLFTDMDTEDEFVAAEYLAMVAQKQHTNVRFSACDRNLIQSIDWIRKNKSLQFPTPWFLLQKYSN